MSMERINFFRILPARVVCGGREEVCAFMCVCVLCVCVCVCVCVCAFAVA
jgi:hypothetical protein